MSSGTNQERIEQNNSKLNELKNKANNLPEYQNMDEYPKREEMNNAIYTALLEYLSKTNTTEYTPQNDYNPATKKYVDDTLVNVPVCNLGLFSDYPENNRLNLNELSPGVYLLYRDTSTIHLKATYKGNEVLDYFNLIEDNIENRVITLVITKRITDDLPERSYIGEVRYGIIKERNAAYIAKHAISIVLSSSWINISSGTSMTMSPVVRDYPQTITSEKTFTVLPKSTVVPTDDAHFVNKKYVDDNVSGIQVIFWDGESGQDAIDKWDEIYQAHLNSDVLVTIMQPGSFGAKDQVYNYGIKKNSLVDKTSYSCQFYSNCFSFDTVATDGVHDMGISCITARLTIDSGHVTNVVVTNWSIYTPYIKTNYDYSTPYVPLYPGSPATKKYVDDGLVDKYDKTGGEISGDVKVDGDFTLDIEDEDYDAGVKFNRVLDSNLGVILTLLGYADNTNYKPIIRNIGTPQSDYDAANKKYVDDHIVTPDTYLVALKNDGSIDQVTANLTYNKVKAVLTNKTKDVYLDVLYGASRFFVRAIQDFDTNNGPIKFIQDFIGSDGMLRTIEFSLATNDVLTVNQYQIEHWAYKVQDIVANSTNTLTYPSTKAVFDQFQRKPVVVWETDSNFLKAIQADISANPAWQLTGLDMTPFKRIKIYSKAGKGRTTAGATGGMILEMSLDPIAGFADYDGNFVGSVLVQKPNDANRYASLTCAVSADKTKFVVLRQTSLYGTAATTNNDIGADVYKIEGYYD